MRELVRGDVERARDFGVAQNHDLLAEGESSRLAAQATILPPAPRRRFEPLPEQTPASTSTAP